MKTFFPRISTTGAFTVSAIALFFVLSATAQASPWQKDRHTTVGHRGTTVLADENTIAAYQVAYDHGLDLFECDPHLTADKVYVIMHDDTVDRTTNGHGPVSEMTLAEIKALRTKSGQEVPTLEEALVFAREHDMSVYLDLKGPPEDGGELLIKTIRDAGMADREVAGCYHLKTSHMIEKAAPEISTCVSWPYPAMFLIQAKWLGADAVGTLRQLATKPAIKMAHLHGLIMITMPINSEEDLEKFDRKGLDALQSDDPRLLEPYGRQGISE